MAAGLVTAVLRRAWRPVGILNGGKRAYERLVFVQHINRVQMSINKLSGKGKVVSSVIP